MRTCIKCGTLVEAGPCIGCQKAYQAAWRKANPDAQKRWRAENPGRAEALTQAWREANAERVRQTAAAWRLANPDIKSAADANWKKANPKKLRIYEANRREMEATGRLSVGLQDRLLKAQKGRCACCGEPLGADFHMDHILPLALGGTNVDENIQLLRKRCNLQKCAMHPVDFMQSKGRLL